MISVWLDPRKPWVLVSPEMCAPGEAGNPWQTDAERHPFPEGSPGAAQAMRHASLALRIGKAIEFHPVDAVAGRVARSMQSANQAPEVAFGEGYLIGGGGHRSWAAWTTGVRAPMLSWPVIAAERELAGESAWPEPDPQRLPQMRAGLVNELHWWEERAGTDDHWANRQYRAQVEGLVERVGEALSKQ